MSAPHRLYAVVRTDDDYEPSSNQVAAYLSKRDAEQHVARAQLANIVLTGALRELSEKLGDDYWADKGRRARRRLCAKNKALLGPVDDGNNLYWVWQMPLLTNVPEVKR